MARPPATPARSPVGTRSRGKAPAASTAAGAEVGGKKATPAAKKKAKAAAEGSAQLATPAAAAGKGDKGKAAAAAGGAGAEGDVREAQVRRAVKALLRHLEVKAKAAGAAQLFDEDETMNLVVTLKKVPRKAKTNPYRIEVPNPMYTLEGQEICLFVKDKEGEGHKEAKKRIAMGERCGVTKVLGLSKLRANYKPFEAKRKLCNSYDLFLCDERVLPLLPKLLGKTFFKKKRHPIPVDLTKSDWAAQVQRAARATYLYITGGTSTMVRVGRSAQGEDALVANAMAVVKKLADHVPSGWGNVQSILLKTNESVALPVFTSAPLRA